MNFQNALETLMRQENHFYKIIDEKTILIAADTPANRKTYEDLVLRTFYLSNGDITDVSNALRNLVAKQAAHHCPDTSAHQAIVILHRLGAGDLHVVAFLPGRLDRLAQGFDTDNLGAARGADDAIAGDRPGCCHDNGTDHKPGYG